MNAAPNQVRLRVRLRGYQEPDTRSDFEGYLGAGKYVVLEYRENYPDAETDYALVAAPSLGAGDTWICTRWRQQRYADLVQVAPPAPAPDISLEDDALAIDESSLIELLPSFLEFTYDLDEARYPYELAGVRVPLAPPATNNCCTFVEALLARAWADACPGGFEWTADRHRQMMVMSSDDFFSPVTAAIESGMAVAAADHDALPRPWTIVQGWRQKWRGGHTFIVVDHDPATDRVLTLESNSAYGLDGVGCRKLGNLRDFSSARPPARWWEQASLWTWQDVCIRYRFREQAALKVRGRSWSGR